MMSIAKVVFGTLGLIASVAACSAETGTEPEPASVPQVEEQGVAPKAWTCSTTSLGGGRWSRFCAEGSTGCVAIYSGGQWGGWDCNR